MDKRVFIIHGCDGYPDEGWFPWLKTELEKKDFQVQIPMMLEPAEPKIEAWVSQAGSGGSQSRFSVKWVLTRI